MLMISTSGYFNPQNDFFIKEVFVSNETEVYILKASESFIPYLYPGNAQELFDSIKNSYYPSYAMSTVRMYEDDDAKSLATFLMGKIHALDMNKKNSHKALFDVLSSFGMEKK